MKWPYLESTVTLPPGWASKWTTLTAWRLLGKAVSVARSHHTPLRGLVVTSPHYLDLVMRACEQMPVFYYCSDDYAQYVGWGGDSILRREAELVRAVSHSFFVSRSLAERAAIEYGVPANRVSVSANATEQAFLRPVEPDQIVKLRSQFPRLRSPLAGVVGAINERLDFDLLLECAECPRMGTLLMIGPVADELRHPAWLRLQNHPRCLIVGARPHAELPVWMQMLDVALIPYRKSALNHSCSPMRLFDHLAAGRPIVATDACQQILEHGDQVNVCGNAAEFVKQVETRISTATAPSETEARRQVAQINLWSSRARTIAAVIENHLS